MDNALIREEDSATFDRSAPSMETDKTLTIASMVIAGLVTLLFVLDAALGLPFGRTSMVLDILFAAGGAFVLWQGIETYREFR